MLKSVYHNLQTRCLYRAIPTYGRNALVVLGTIMMGLAPAFAVDGSDTNAPRKIATKHFASGQQALRGGPGRPEGRRYGSAQSLR